MDLSKCFDRLSHELILKGVKCKVTDGSVLKLIQQFLSRGVMEDIDETPTSKAAHKAG
jgi:RNA-directed DNA polymerase